MKNSLFWLVLFLSLFTFQLTIAADSEVVHTLEPGQTLSADVLNEIFEALAYTDKIPTKDDFLGSWQCRRSSTSSEATSLYSSYTFEDGLLYVVTGNITFTTDGAGNYYATETSSPTVLYPVLGGGISNVVMTDKPYVTKDAFLYLTFDVYNDLMSPPQWVEEINVYKSIFRNATQFSLEHNYTMNTGNNGGPIICDRIDIPPSIPDLTDFTVLGSKVELQWIDKSDNETGFNVLRRDSLEGDWQQIAQVESVTGIDNTVSFTDQGLSFGIYWYRVQSENNYGTSLGSNVITVEIQ